MPFQEETKMENIEKTISNKKSKRERFVRIVEKRVNVLLTNLDSLGKCSNRRNYEYSNEDVKKVFSAIEKKVRDTRLLFSGVEKNKNEFR